MANFHTSLAEAQIDFSEALFRFWLQPFQLAQAAFAAGSQMIAKSGGASAATESAKPEVVEAAEEKIAHLDDEMDLAVPEAAAVVA